MKLRVFTSFSGYDSQCLALRRLGIDFDLVGWSEIDSHAIKAHNVLFPEYSERNYGDIAKIDWQNVPDFDLFTYSSPCQDFSLAGLRKGGEEGSGTRSSLLWECRKAIMTKKPKYLLMENVANLLGKQFKPLLGQWLDTLSKLGYINYVKLLNAKSFGVPQNRNRVFVVSILGSATFFWPKEQKLEKCLGDVLEHDVDESYYLSDKQLAYMLNKNDKPNNHYFFSPKSHNSIANALTVSKGWGYMTDNYVADVMQVGNILPEGNYANPTRGRIYSVNGVAPTLNCVGGGNLEPKIVVLGHYQNSKVSGEVVSPNHLSPTAMYNKSQVTATIDHEQRIRKLTPREFYRLMGLKEREIDLLLTSIKAKSANYKLAGNSIVVDVLVNIFRKMFINKGCEETQQLKLF